MIFPIKQADLLNTNTINTGNLSERCSNDLMDLRPKRFIYTKMKKSWSNPIENIQMEEQPFLIIFMLIENCGKNLLNALMVLLAVKHLSIMKLVN